MRHLGTPLSSSQTYPIIGADGFGHGAVGVIGKFQRVTTSLAFFTPSLSYENNNVIVTLARNDASFASVGATPNHFAVAPAVENFGFGHPLHDALVMLDAETARSAFDQFSGEIHASAKTALIEDSGFLREAATDRVRAAFDAVAAPAMPVLSYGPDGPDLSGVGAASDRFAMWGQAFGSWGHWDGDGNAARLERDTGGFIVGADALVGDIWRLGVLTGYSHSSFNVDDRAASGSSDNYHLGVYGGSKWGGLGLRFGAAYTWSDIDTDRTIAFPGFSEEAEASYDAGTAQVFGELGYRIDTAVAAFEPFAGLAYVNLDSDGFDEDGGDAALSVDGETSDTTFTTLGLRASSAFALGSMPARLQGMLGWRHAFGDVTPRLSHAFDGGDAFTIAGVPIAEDAAVIEAGLDLDFTANATFGVSYNGQIASDAQDHGLKADLKVRF